MKYLIKINLLILAALLLAACSSNNSGKVHQASITVQTGAKLNPNSRGRPSPVAITLYQLKDKTKFSNATYRGLIFSTKKTLASDLVKEQKFVIAPSRKVMKQWSLAKDVRYIGVVVSYHHLSRHEWRAIIPMNTSSGENKIDIHLK
ncbi:MAG: type VI secretion system lipoprotein TssJ [Gammaproteobacteria bacterium]|nr:type VI secretion system lipoprotein TssJ [Gammaproteobacteria bacterium]